MKKFIDQIDNLDTKIKVIVTFGIFLLPILIICILSVTNEKNRSSNLKMESSNVASQANTKRSSESQNYIEFTVKNTVNKSDVYYKKTVKQQEDGSVVIEGTCEQPNALMQYFNGYTSYEEPTKFYADDKTGDFKIVIQPDNLEKLYTSENSDNCISVMSKYKDNDHVSVEKLVYVEKNSKFDYESYKQQKEAERIAKESSEKAAKESIENSADPNVSYEQLARTPQNYYGKKLQYYGEVMQVVENQEAGKTIVMFWVNGDSDQLMYVTIDNSLLNGSRILEDDTLTIRGDNMK
ncbi:hypothetical protein HCG60_11580 [Ligilactobacillus murinus]|uniref:hypothetical protein n=1 Tax=Ligilactobacillus murinus TaxID=1622 RepID=UPI001C8C78D3|nr:hypothetical protein [Ligilactobacillus murinus]MBX9013650.1 hypothetical protein [Ligilactobacillus murinus]